MIFEHWFWLTITAVCLLWYTTITVYVAIKGLADIRNMIRRLNNERNAAREAPSPAKGDEE